MSSAGILSYMPPVMPAFCALHRKLQTPWAWAGVQQSVHRHCSPGQECMLSGSSWAFDRVFHMNCQGIFLTHVIVKRPFLATLMLEHRPLCTCAGTQGPAFCCFGGQDQAPVPGDDIKSGCHCCHAAALNGWLLNFDHGPSGCTVSDPTVLIPRTFSWQGKQKHVLFFDCIWPCIIREHILDLSVLDVENVY